MYVARYCPVAVLQLLASLGTNLREAPLLYVWCGQNQVRRSVCLCPTEARQSGVPSLWLSPPRSSGLRGIAARLDSAESTSTIYVVWEPQPVTQSLTRGSKLNKHHPVVPHSGRLDTRRHEAYPASGVVWCRIARGIWREKSERRVGWSAINLREEAGGGRSRV